MNNLEKVRSILANRVRSIRLSKGLTQEQLAEAADIHTTYISRIESSKKLPTIPIVCKIADSLGVEAYELLLSETKLNSYEYKKKKLINLVKESGSATIDIHTALLNTLNKLKKKL